MKKTFFLFALTLFTFISINAQKYMTRSGYIGFFSHTPVEDIKAENNQVASVLDMETGELVFQALMRSFKFEKKLMEEHFNENYVESEKFPKSAFKGSIANFKELDLKKDGNYEVTVNGELTIHGVSRQVSEKGEISVKNGKVEAQSVFIVKPEDYDIEIPGVVRNKIAEEMEVTVKMNYEEM